MLVSVAGLTAATGTTSIDLELAESARLERILAVALAAHPDVGELDARARAASARASAADHLPDLEVKYEQWRTPLARPWRLDEAELMFGVRQMIPAWGTRGARVRAEEEGSRILASTARARALELAASVRRTFAEYVRAEAEHEIHERHVDVTHGVVELARSAYRSGRASQEDVLRAAASLSRHHRDLLELERARASGRATLNMLMSRPPDAPLGPPSTSAPLALPTELEVLMPIAERSRPELAGVRHAVARSEAELDGSRRSASYPSFMLGADYMLMPAHEERHAYQVMVSLNLPWLSGARGDQVRASEELLLAERRAEGSVRNTIRWEVHEAVLRYRSARAVFELCDGDLLPRAREGLSSAQAAFAAGAASALAVLDALRGLLDAELEHARARAALEQSGAELLRATGAEPDDLLAEARARGARSTTEGGAR